MYQSKYNNTWFKYKAVLSYLFSINHYKALTMHTTCDTTCKWISIYPIYQQINLKQFKLRHLHFGTQHVCRNLIVWGRQENKKSHARW